MTQLAVLPHARPPRRFSAGLLAVILLIGSGCVSQQTYDKTKAEADELRRTLEAERIGLTELDHQIAVLHDLNKKEDAAATDARAAIQHELETAPIRRQQAEEQQSALQTQMAQLINQIRTVKREMAEAKQERTSLQAMVTQYKQELDEGMGFSTPTASNSPVPSTALSPLTPIPSAVSPSNPPTPTPSPNVQATPEPPVKPVIPVRPTKGGPAQEDDSWTGLIKSWVSSIWEWIFG